MYLIYNLLSWPVALLLSPWVLFRAWRGRLPGLGQRLGLIPPVLAPSSGSVIWLHAVSLGEVKAAAPLLEEFRARFPQLRVVLTTSTRTGWEAARAILRSEETVLFPPLDLAWICRRFLRRIRPQAVLVMETELWPNLFREVKRSGIPLLLVNGRISNRAYPRYRASRFFWRRVLAQPDAILAQSTRDAERFIAIGAPPQKVEAAGNLKFAIRPDPAAIVPRLRAMTKEATADPILVAGSTMPGEEKFLLAAFRELAQEFPRLWMILAPRHPERFEAVAEEVRAWGVPMRRRSELNPQTQLELPGVLLLDSTGELGSVYELATVAFVGGTLVPTGGHNILEAAYFGKPIVIGPSMSNFQEIAEVFLQDAGQGEIPGAVNARVGAIVQVSNAQQVVPALRFLFRYADARQRIGAAARRLFREQASATDRVAEQLERFLRPPLRSAAAAGTTPPQEMAEARQWREVQK